jgi:hypothetical protein
MPLDPSLGAQIRLAIQATGEDQAARLRQAFLDLSNAAQGLATDFAQGQIAFGPYAREMVSINTEMGRLRGAADAAGVAIVGLTDMKQRAAQAARDLADANRQLNAMGALTEAQVREDVALRGRQAGAILEVEAEERRLTQTLYALAAASDMTEKMTAREIETWRRSRGEMQQAGQGYSNVSFAMMNFSYTLQDLTSANGDWERGLMATINNVPLLATSFSQAAGITQQAAMMWGAGLGVVAVAAMELYRNWDGLMRALDLGATQTEAQRMEELGKKTNRTAFETAELNKHKRELADIERIMQLQSREEKDRARMVEEAVGEMGAGKAREGVMEAMRQRGMLAGPTRAEREAIAYRESEIARLGGPEAQLAQIDVRKLEALRTAQALRIAEKNEQLVAAQITGAAKDPTGLLNLAQGRPDLFPPEFVGAMMEAQPERMRQRRLDERDVENQRRRIASEEAERKKAEADAAREAELARQELEKGNREAGAARERREREAKGVVEAQKRAREQQVAAGVGQFAPEMMKVEGKDSFMSAVFEGVRARAKDAEIQAALGPEMRRAIGEQGAQANLITEIANGIIEKGIAKARAIMAADAGAAREAKQARKGAVAAKQTDVGEAAAGLERGFGVPPGMAEAMAPGVAKAIDMGVNPNAAAQVAIAQMRQTLRNQEMLILRQNAMWEQANNIFGEASQRLMMMEMQQHQAEARMRAMVNRRPGLMPVVPMFGN